MEGNGFDQRSNIAEFVRYRTDTFSGEADSHRIGWHSDPANEASSRSQIGVATLAALIST
ncbi:MAG: hypothetical protein ACYDE0_08280 [Acidiferrobacterales bacterium]